MARSAQLRVDTARRGAGGRYSCRADNGVGRAAEAEVEVSVLAPPSVRVLAHR